MSATAKDQRCGDNSHKRDTNARRKPRAVTVAAPLALMATVSAVGLGVLASDPVVDTVVASTATNDILVDRDDAPVTRSTSRTRLHPALDAAVKIPNAMSEGRDPARPIKKADTRLWTTDELNIWDEPGDEGRAARRARAPARRSS